MRWKQGRQLDIDDIKLFLEVVFDSSISEAARKSYVSQQTVSRKISQIEKEVGCKLLERTTPITPTPAGRVFLRDSGKVVAAYEQLLSETRAVGCKPPATVRIKSYNNSSFTVIMALLAECLETQHPNVAIERVYKNEDDIEMIRADQLDIGFVRDIEVDGVSKYQRQPDIQYARIESNTFPLVFAVQESHPLLKGGPSISLADIARHRIAMPTNSNRGALPAAIARLFADNGLVLRTEPIFCNDLVEYFSSISPDSVVFFNEVDESRIEYLSALAQGRYVAVRPADACYEVASYAVWSKTAAGDETGRVAQLMVDIDAKLVAGETSS